MAQLLDLTGQVFGRLTVIRRADNDGKYNQTRWLCKCLCGNERIVYRGALKSGNTKSCGCLSVEVAVKSNTTHGLTHTSEYRIWYHLRGRCNNPSDEAYEDYGGRGIKVCARWAASFENFLIDMGKKPSPNHSIDRIDNDGDYEPSNCRWATQKEQCGNRRNNKWFEHAGKRMILADWAAFLGIDGANLHYKIKRSSFEEAYTFYMNKNRAKRG